MVNLFIIYAGEDYVRLKVSDLTNALKKQSFVGEVKTIHSVREEFLDEFGGDYPFMANEDPVSFLAYLKKVLENADIFIVLCTDESNSSVFIKQIFSWLSAKNIKRPLIPVYTKPDYMKDITSMLYGIKFNSNISELVLETIPSIKYIIKALDVKSPVHNYFQNISIPLAHDEDASGNQLSFRKRKFKDESADEYEDLRKRKSMMAKANERAFGKNYEILHSMLKEVFSSYLNAQNQPIGQSTVGPVNYPLPQLSYEIRQEATLESGAGELAHATRDYVDLGEYESLEDFDQSYFLFKALILGDDASHKTNLFRQVIQNQIFQEPEFTIGVEFYVYQVQYGGRNRGIFQLWDFCNENRFEFLRNDYYAGASLSFGVFNILNRSSWTYLKNRLLGVEKSWGKIPFFIIGYNPEMAVAHGSLVDLDEVREFAEDHEGFFIEVGPSAEGLSPEYFTRCLNLTIQRYSDFEFNPTEIIQKIKNNKGLSVLELLHPDLGPSLDFILKKIEHVDNPVANEFRSFLNQKFSVRIGNFRILL